MTAFTQDLLAGLQAQPRQLSPKWFYDTAGSRLFEQICELPEYYPTRTELALLDRHAPEFAQRMGPGAEIVEFGAGASVKVRMLLAASGQVRCFVPIDISGEYLAGVATELRSSYPGLAVVPVAGDFTTDIDLPAAEGTRLGFFPGSSIGNFEPAAAQALLQRFAGWLQGGALLIGVDLVKHPAELHAAYNDAQGVTAAFNLNLLTRANREAGADFRLPDWDHAAFYHPGLRRIEMHLVSRRAQSVCVAGEHFAFEEGESIHTENSYKYSVAGFQALARRAGWSPRQVWVDGAQRFSLHWLEPDQAANAASAASARSAR